MTTDDDATHSQQFTSPLTSILLSVFLFMMAVGLLNIFLSVRMSLAEVNAQVLGVVMACYFAGMMAGSLYSRVIIARVGHIRSFTAFAAVATISVILHGLFEGLTTWAILRILTGFSLAGMYMVIESWLQEIAPHGNRGALFSLYMVSNYLGMASGQLMLNVGNPMNMDLVLVIALLFALCLIPIALTRATHPAQIELHPIEFMNFLRKAPIGSLGSFGSGMVLGAYLALAPAWGIQKGLQTSDISAFMALSIVGGLVLQWPIGKLSDRYDRGWLMMILGFLLVVLPLGFLFDTGILTLTLLGATVFGGIAYSIYPLSVCYANDYTPEGQFVMTTTVMLLLYGIGAAIGPVVAALFMWLLGFNGLFIFIMATAIAMGVLTWHWRRKGEIEHQTAFVAVPRTTLLVTELDPRAEDDIAPEEHDSDEDQTAEDETGESETVEDIRI